MKHTLKIRFKKQIIFFAIFNLSVLLGYGQLPSVPNLSRYVEGKIILVNGQELDGLIKVPGTPRMVKIKFKEGKKSEVETIVSEEVQTLLLNNSDGSQAVMDNLYANRNYKNPDDKYFWRYPLFLLKVMDGYDTIYGVSDGYRISRSGKIISYSNSSTLPNGGIIYNSRTDYYIRTGDTTAVYFASDNWSKKKIRKQCLSRFGDCQEVVDFIERGGGKRDDLEYIFKLYNNSKAKEFPEKEVPKLEKNNPELPQW